MTISSTVRVAGPYSGNDVTVTFSFAFKVFAAADVQVILTDSTDTESVLTLTTDYTVTLNANQDVNPGGSVTLITAPATGEKLTVTSDQASYQSVNLANQGGFYPEVINNQLDKLAINIQQCERDIAQAARVPLSSTIDPDIVSDALITVATSIGDVETVAGSIGDVGTVATNIANVNLVGGDIANVNSVAGDLANIDAVAGDLSNVDIVAADIADVSTCADNIVLIQSAPANAASASASASAASASASLALAANEAAEAAASASGDVLFYDTKADADAALSGLAENQIVEVMADEEVSGLRTRYRVETGAYVFKIIIGEAKVSTVAALRAIPYSAMLTTAATLGCLAADDDGGGLWRWDASVLAATPDNTGTIVRPTGHVGDGAWVRVTGGDVVSPTWWGFSASATAAQNAAALQAALDTGLHIQAPAGTFDYNTTLTLPTNGRITGAGMRATTLNYTGTGFAITFAVGGCIENVKLTGTTNSDGAITLANCGLGEIKSVDIGYFQKAGAIAIKLDECYRIKLSYLYLHYNSNGIVLSGNITAFEFDKGNVATCSEYALKQISGNTELRINGVYFESNYGINPIYIAVYGSVYLNGCHFEDNCGTSGSNPRVIQVDNPCRLELMNCNFSPLTAAADMFTGAAYAIYLGTDAPHLRVVNCETADNTVQAGLPVYFCRVFGGSTIGILHFENNRFNGSRFTTNEEAEAFAFGGFDHLYFPKKFTSINNVMRNKLHTRLPSLYSQFGGSTASTGTAYTYWTRTFNKKSHANGFIVKILAWGRRTGAGGNQKITLTLTEIGGAAPTVIDVTPNSTEENWRTEIVINWHVYNGQRVSVFAMDGATPSISNTLTTLNTSTYDFSIALGAALASGTDVTYLDGMAVTLE